ncbi:hypothetical protein [Acinetobacter baumannii]|uniref:hypothetical protein n=1 Tax=Acinetobacter baumannii TaxID=470 RepID=UPI0023420768|nr:hypothetical protein [Acinetobacter baumannii]MDC4147571.1 hypothetical protein [Acinetobacter baumannii]
MAKLSTEYSLPLKVVAARCENLKYHFKGIFSKIEKRAIEYKNENKKVESLVTWDDWIYSALDCYAPNWKKGLKIGEPIPDHLINNLPCPTGELVSLGSWMLTKNIYRFVDDVAQELVKSKFEGNLPNFLINVSDLCIYVQTDNFDLKFKENKIYGVIFTVTELCYQKVLVSTVFLDTGLSRTIVLVLNEDKPIEDCLSDFIDEFHDDRAVLDQSEIDEYQSLQKQLINILLWFSLSKPDYQPLIPENHTEKTGLQIIKRQPRLFEAQKYKPFMAGNETAKQIKIVKDQLNEYKSQNAKVQRRPHLRRAHYHLYWYGAKGSYEKYEFKWIPITLVGGVLKDN